MLTYGERNVYDKWGKITAEHPTQIHQRDATYEVLLGDCRVVVLSFPRKYSHHRLYLNVTTKNVPAS